MAILLCRSRCSAWIIQEDHEALYPDMDVICYFCLDTSRRQAQCTVGYGETLSSYRLKASPCSDTGRLS